GAESSQQIVIGPSRLGHGRPELCPDQAVAHAKYGSKQPAQHGLGSAHRRERQRDGDERPNADHVEYIGRQGTWQPYRTQRLYVTAGLRTGHGMWTTCPERAEAPAASASARAATASV